MPLQINGATSGSTTVQATDAVTATLTLPSSTGTLVIADGSNNLQINSGYGSVATAYGCRAWVNFNGTGTVAIRASGNVSSITDNGTGNYTVNFTTAMPDVNYAVIGSCVYSTGINAFCTSTPLTTSTTVRTLNQSSGTTSAIDPAHVQIAIFR